MNLETEKTQSIHDVTKSVTCYTGIATSTIAHVDKLRHIHDSGLVESTSDNQLNAAHTDVDAENAAFTVNLDIPETTDMSRNEKRKIRDENEALLYAENLGDIFD